MATGDGAVKPSNGREFVISLAEANGAPRCGPETAGALRQVGRSRQKQFKERASTLTDLYEIIHIKTIYNIFTASFVLLFINLAVNDIVEHKMLRLNLDLIWWHFNGVETAVLAWCLMFGGTMVLYGSFKLWDYLRKQLQSSKLQRPLDLLCVFAYAIYLMAFVCVAPALLLRVTLAPFTKTLVIIEQLRMMMKSHAFVRSNLRHVLGKDDAKEGCAEQKTTDHPNFKQFLYFHFAPTLLYRESYPRTDRVRWKMVTWHFCEVVGIAFYLVTTFEQFMLGHLVSFWDEPLNPPRVIALFFRSLFPGLLFLLLGFYAYFHAWMNAFAELLRFGDRIFYEDWWTTTTFDAYYKSWNVIVHDWMYEYLYLDIVKKFSERPAGGDHPRPTSRSRHFACKALVFLVSAVFHEYVVAVSVRFLYPVMFVLFGIVGVALTYIPNKKGAVGNIFLWLALSIGMATMLSAYSIEYYARQRCEPQKDPILDLVVPRSWTCNMTLQL